jgi:hypothetical protein
MGRLKYFNTTQTIQNFELKNVSIMNLIAHSRMLLTENPT